MKKLFSFVCALVCAMSLSARDLYLVIGHSDWQKNNERFAVYAFDSGEKWYDMTAVDGASNTYKATIDDKYPKVIFCRMNGTSTENNWDNKWDQTIDLTLPTNTNENCYTVNQKADNKYSGSWSVYGEGGEGEGGNTDPSVTEYWYFDENNNKWEGTIDDKWKMTVSGDIAYVKVPAGKANKFKIFPCNPKVDAKVLANDDNIAEGALAGDIALSKDTEQWKNILIGATSAEYFVVLYLPNTATNNSAKYLVAAMTQLPNSGSDPTALTNTEVKNAAVKVIRNGQVLIVREGVTYNMMGQTIQ